MSVVPDLTRGQGRYFTVNPPLPRRVSALGEERALELFRACADTVDIARALQCTPAAAANALARARDRERQP